MPHTPFGVALLKQYWDIFKGIRISTFEAFIELVVVSNHHKVKTCP
jgi:hypothetical protein